MPRLPQVEFAKLTLRAQMEKLQIEEKFRKGETLNDLAKHYNVNDSTIKDVLDTLGIARPRRNAVVRAESNLLIKDILIVVARIAKGLGVNYDEIKPYLVNEK